MDTSIIAFADKIRDIQTCISYLRDLGLLCATKLCLKCHKHMTLKSKPIRVTRDQQQWVCQKCNTSLSIRHGSLFKVSFQ